MKNRKHLSRRELYAIERGIQSGESYAEIAAGIGCHRTTVSRLARQDGGYAPGRPRAGGYRRIAVFDADKSLSARRFRQTSRDTSSVSDAAIGRVVEAMAANRCGPQLALLVAGVKGTASAGTLYRRIEKNRRAGGVWHLSLPRGRRRRGGKKRGGGGVIRDRVSISARPAGANNRTRFGHWEGDLVIGQGSAVAVTLTERKSGKNLWALAKNKRSRTIARAMCRALAGHVVKSITLDNGTEFARHEIIARRLGCAIYFADPRSPQQRGANENANGLLRRFYGKKTDFAKVSKTALNAAAEIINNRPTLIHSGLSRNQVYYRSHRAF